MLFSPHFVFGYTLGYSCGLLLGTGAISYAWCCKRSTKKPNLKSFGEMKMRVCGPDITHVYSETPQPEDFTQDTNDSCENNKCKCENESCKCEKNACEGSCECVSANLTTNSTEKYTQDIAEQVLGYVSASCEMPLESKVEATSPDTQENEKCEEHEKPDEYYKTE